MIIDSSFISMASSHSLVQEYQKTEELTLKVSNVKPQAEEVPTADKVSISDKALQYLDNDLLKALERLEKHMDRARNHPGKGYGKAMRHLAKDLDKAIDHLEKHMDRADKHPGKGYRKAMRHLTKDLDKALDHLEKHMKKVEDSEVNEIRGIKINSMESNKYGLSKDLLEAMTGRKIRLHDIDDISRKHHKRHDDDDHVKGTEEKQRWEVSYNMKETLYESEQMNFNSNGIVRTADGRVINFSLDLMMSRQYMEENEISFEASGTGKANILVDFAGPASALTDTKFGFGIEPEESGDSLSYLALGSGLLTLDLNNDGQIDSMNELVGNATGNGFAELAAYDQDGNGWIDENDAVYERLKILSQGSEGNDVLTGLKDSNIGAINLGSVDSPYALKNDQNVIVGQIEKSGIYLTEEGTVEQVQQLSKIV